MRYSYARWAAAPLGVIALVTGASPAQARQVADPLDWTKTPIGHEPALLNDIDATAAGTWAVGTDLVNDFDDQRPFAVRWESGHWIAMPQPFGKNSVLHSIAVAGADDVWAVGEDDSDPQNSKPLAVHWDGSAWNVVPAPVVPLGLFGDVKIGPGGQPWVTGWARVDGVEHGVVYRYSGSRWEALSDGLEDTVSGNTLNVVSATDAWLGLNGGLAHFDGKRWTQVVLPAGGDTLAASGFATKGPKDIWLAGVEHDDHTPIGAAMILHYDGVSWTRIPAPKGSMQLYDIALKNGRPVAVGEQFEGTNFVSKPVVLQYDGTLFGYAPSPTAAEGTLTTAAALKGRLWAGGQLSTATSYSAFAAVAK